MDVDTARYARQIMMPEIGLKGQKKLSKASVLVVGAGGLGAPVLMYLAAAGVGHLGIVDNDHVSLSNLQRQLLYRDEDIGKLKVEQAALELQQINPNLHLECYPLRLNHENAPQIMQHYDLIIDACDNYTTRLLLDQCTLALRKPLIYGTVEGFRGQIALFSPDSPTRYSDLFGDLSEDADKDNPPVGIIGASAGVIGAIQACEAIKLLVEHPSALSSKLLTIDLLEHKYQLFDL